MFVVTGGAGFIGSHLVAAMNARGIAEILVVDDLSTPEKHSNLAGRVVADVLSKAEFRQRLRDGPMPPVRGVLHQGGVTDTQCRDQRQLLACNVTASIELLEFALHRGVPFVYASSGAVYGSQRDAREVPRNERPINAYGQSKLAFDQHVRRAVARARNTVLGLRYFNVYGQHEWHKGRKASMVLQFYQQLTSSGSARIFEGTDGFAAGEHRRDFVHVDDVVEVNLAALFGSCRRGVVNVGTGRSRSFNDVANTLIKILGVGQVEYVPMNPELRRSYQSYSQADLTSFRSLGLPVPTTSLEDGIERCVAAWRGKDQDAGRRA